MDNTTKLIDNGATYLGAEQAHRFSNIFERQPTPASKSVSATLTPAELFTKIIKVNQAAGAAVALQLPTVASLEAALPAGIQNEDSFEFSLINISTVDAEDATITTNTGWTLVGDISVPAKSAAGSLNTSGRFRAVRTSSTAWVLYRL